jgi:hypothetical protein
MDTFIAITIGGIVGAIAGAVFMWLMNRRGRG